MSGPWVDLVKVRGLFSKKATKGYLLFLALDHRSDGADWTREREMVDGDPSGGAMAGEEKLAGVLGEGPTVHDLTD